VKKEKSYTTCVELFNVQSPVCDAAVAKYTVLYLPQHRNPINMEVRRRPVLDAFFLFPVAGSVWLKACVWEDIFPLFRKLGTA
jgi:hypothetical protein